MDVNTILLSIHQPKPSRSCLSYIYFLSAQQACVCVRSTVDYATDTVIYSTQENCSLCAVLLHFRATKTTNPTFASSDSARRLCRNHRKCKSGSIRRMDPLR